MKRPPNLRASQPSKKAPLGLTREAAADTHKISVETGITRRPTAQVPTALENSPMSANALPAPIANLPTVRVVNLRPQAKGSLRAFVDLELTRIGLVLRDCTWHRHDGKEWIGCRRSPIRAATASPDGSRSLSSPRTLPRRAGGFRKRRSRRSTSSRRVTRGRRDDPRRRAPPIA